MAGQYQHTSATSVSDVFHIHSANHLRLYVFYDGNDTFKFKILKRTCHMNGQQDTWGTLTSFNKVDEDGAVLCPHSRYKPGTIPYRVTIGAGC